MSNTSSNRSRKGTVRGDQTGRQNRNNNRGNGGTMIKTASTATLMAEVNSRVTKGDIIIPNNISRSKALAIYPTTALIAAGLMHDIFTPNGWSQQWHQDVTSASVEIDENVSIAPLGINAILVIDQMDDTETRLTLSEIALMLEQGLNNKHQLSNLSQNPTTFASPGFTKHYSLKQMLDKGFAYETTTGTGQKVTIARDQIMFHELIESSVDRLTHVKLFVGMIDQDRVVLAREHKGKMRFRTIRTDALFKAITAGFVNSLIVTWNSFLDDQHNGDTNNVVQVSFSGNHRGDASQAVVAKYTQKRVIAAE